MILLEGRSNQDISMATTRWVLWTRMVVVEVVKFGYNSNIFEERKYLFITG